MVSQTAGAEILSPHPEEPATKKGGEEAS